MSKLGHLRYCENQYSDAAMFTSSILTLARPTSRCAHIVPSRCHHLPRVCQRRERRQLGLAGAPVTFRTLTAEGPATTNDFTAPSGILGASKGHGRRNSSLSDSASCHVFIKESWCLQRHLTPIPPHANASPRLHIVFLEGLI